jgi:hypothetical protein
MLLGPLELDPQRLLVGLEVSSFICFGLKLIHRQSLHWNHIVSQSGNTEPCSLTDTWLCFVYTSITTLFKIPSVCRLPQQSATRRSLKVVVPSRLGRRSCRVPAWPALKRGGTESKEKARYRGFISSEDYRVPPVRIRVGLDLLHGEVGHGSNSLKTF